MSHTVRKAKDIYRWPRVYTNKLEATRAKWELKEYGYKPSNRIKSRSNMYVPRGDETYSSGWKEKYIPEESSLTK